MLTEYQTRVIKAARRHARRAADYREPVYMGPGTIRAALAAAFVAGVGWQLREHSGELRSALKATEGQLGRTARKRR